MAASSSSSGIASASSAADKENPAAPSSCRRTHESERPTGLYAITIDVINFNTLNENAIYHVYVLSSVVAYFRVQFRIIRLNSKILDKGPPYNSEKMV